jgi:hypothetical protein
MSTLVATLKSRLAGMVFRRPRGGLELWLESEKRWTTEQSAVMRVLRACLSDLTRETVEASAQLTILNSNNAKNRAISLLTDLMPQHSSSLDVHQHAVHFVSGETVWFADEFDRQVRVGVPSDRNERVIRMRFERPDTDVQNLFEELVKSFVRCGAEDSKIEVGRDVVDGLKQKSQLFSLLFGSVGGDCSVLMDLLSLTAAAVTGLSPAKTLTIVTGRTFGFWSKLMSKALGSISELGHCATAQCVIFAARTLSETKVKKLMDATVTLLHGPPSTVRVYADHLQQLAFRSKTNVIWFAPENPKIHRFDLISHRTTVVRALQEVSYESLTECMWHSLCMELFEIMRLLSPIVKAGGHLKRLSDATRAEITLISELQREVCTRVDRVQDLRDTGYLRPAGPTEKPSTQSYIHKTLVRLGDSDPVQHMKFHGFEFRTGGPTLHHPNGATERLVTKAYFKDGAYWVLSVPTDTQTSAASSSQSDVGSTTSSWFLRRNLAP